ncbi:MAG: tetratricopeptide repeat protein [Elainellaceae cyanobacterium]
MIQIIVKQARSIALKRSPKKMSAIRSSCAGLLSLGMGLVFSLTMAGGWAAATPFSPTLAEISPPPLVELSPRPMTTPVAPTTESLLSGRSESAPDSRLTLTEQRELAQLRLESQIQRIVQDKLNRSPEVQDRIELEVDRAFERTTTILNMLLAILTAIPIVVALFVWLLRRSVISQLVSEVRTQLEQEVYGEIKAQKSTVIQEIEKNKGEALAQLIQIVHEAETVLSELKAQITIANEELDILKSQTAFQLENMVSDAETVKNRTIQEISSLLPLSIQETLPPDLQPRIGKLTALLDILKSNIPQLTFTASDYIKQGNALVFESRYDDAIAAYDKALQLDADLYEAWFGKASSLVMLQDYDDALIAYQTALAQKPDSAEAWVGQGAVLRKLQRLDEALSAYRCAHDLKPEDIRISLNQGNLLLELQQYEEALAAFDQAIAIKPDNIKACLGKIEALWNLQQIEPALQTCETALAHHSEDPDLWYAKGICLTLQGNSASATHALSVAISLNENYREKATTDAMFESIRDTPEFRLRVVK